VQVNTQSDITPPIANKTLMKINLTKKNNKNYFLIKNASSSLHNIKHEYDNIHLINNSNNSNSNNNKWGYLRNDNSFVSKHFRKRNIIALNYITNTTTSFLTKNESLPKKPPLHNNTNKTTKKLKLKSLHNNNNIHHPPSYVNQEQVLSNIKLKPITTLRSKLPTLNKFISKSKKS
jgi:hypothetical protein